MPQFRRRLGLYFLAERLLLLPERKTMSVTDVGMLLEHHLEHIPC